MQIGWWCVLQPLECPKVSKTDSRLTEIFGWISRASFALPKWVSAFFVLQKLLHIVSETERWPVVCSLSLQSVSSNTAVVTPATQNQNVVPINSEYCLILQVVSTWAKGESASEANAASLRVCEGVSPVSHPWFILGPACSHSVNQKTGTHAPAHLGSLIILSPKRVLWGLIFL